MSDNEFKRLLIEVWRILKECGFISTENLFKRVTEVIATDRESVAFVLGWLANEKRVTVRKENEEYIVYDNRCYDFAFG